MTHFLVSDENPKGYKLEDILLVIRKDILTRCLKIADDRRAEAQHVVGNNMKVLGLLEQCIHLAADSTQVLDKAFGPSKPGAPPRVGS